MDEQSKAKGKILGPPIGYIDMLDIAMTDREKKNSEKPRDKNPLRPSSAGKCQREKAYEFMEYRGFAKYEKEPLSPQTLRIFDLGHSVEYHLLKQFYFVEQFQVRYKQQVLTFYPLAPGEVVEGSIDVVFYSPKYRCVADVKSKKDKFSSYYATKWDEDTNKLRNMKSVRSITEDSFWVEDLEQFLFELNDPFFRSNFVQLNMYAVNEFLTARGVDHAAIIQYNKNDSRLREVRFKPSLKVYQDLVAIDQNVVKVVDETKDPEKVARDYTLGSIKCAFCDFKTHCWGEELNPLKEYFAGLPDKKVWPKDTDRLAETGREIETLFAAKGNIEQASSGLNEVDQSIIKMMLDKKLKKVRLASGAVFELKTYKSPHPHIKLIRSKV